MTCSSSSLCSAGSNFCRKSVTWSYFCIADKPWRKVLFPSYRSVLNQWWFQWGFTHIRALQHHRFLRLALWQQYQLRHCHTPPGSCFLLLSSNSLIQPLHSQSHHSDSFTAKKSSQPYTIVKGAENQVPVFTLIFFCLHISTIPSCFFLPHAHTHRGKKQKNKQENPSTLQTDMTEGF